MRQLPVCISYDSTIIVLLLFVELLLRKLNAHALFSGVKTAVRKRSKKKLLTCRRTNVLEESIGTLGITTWEYPSNIQAFFGLLEDK